MLISHAQIGTNMKKARILAGLSQEEFAHRLGMSVVNYGRIERSDRKISLDMLAKAANLLGISPYDLLNGCSRL